MNLRVRVRRPRRALVMNFYLPRRNAAQPLAVLSCDCIWKTFTGIIPRMDAPHTPDAGRQTLLDTLSRTSIRMSTHPTLLINIPTLIQHTD